MDRPIDPVPASSTGELALATSADPVVARPGNRVLWAPKEDLDLGPDVSEDLPRYREWVAARQARRLAKPATAPLAAPELAFLLVLDDPDPGGLDRCLAALAAQTSGNWRLSVSVTGPLGTEAEAVLGRSLGMLPAGRTDVYRCVGTTAVDAMRGALHAAPSPAFSPLRPDDELAPDAVALLTAALVDADVAYADEDRIGGDGQVLAPALKPDWSPELLLAENYLGRPVAMRRAPVEAAGGLRPLADGDWEHDLLLRVTEGTERVAHVPEVLCRRHHHPPPQAWATGDQAVVDALARRMATADVEPGPSPGTWHVHWRPSHRPAVTAIIPFRDAPRLLRACVGSVTATASDVDLELVLVDNGSEELETQTLLDRLAARADVTVIQDPRPFNWAVLNNGAAQAARGEVLLFLNNDIEALRPGWLGALAAQALREEVGAAGARLLFPSGRLQHAGVVLGMAGPAGHVLVGLPGDRPGYLGMAVLARDCSAVTGACLATRASVFERLGGFDETLGLDLNDIDYCLRARQRGLRVVYEPAAELIHHESPSRGTSGSAPDQLRFLERWEDVVERGDPFLNPQLTRVECSAGLRGDDEEGWWRRWRANLTR